MTDILSAITAIITCLSPIIIAWLTLKNSKAEKSNQEYRKLREEKEQREKEEKLEKEKKQEQEINDIKKQVSTLTSSVDELARATQASTELFRSKAEEFLKMSTVTFEYCQSLTTAVTKTGQALLTEDSLEQSHSAIQKAMQDHQEEEHRLLKEIYKVRY